MGQIVDLAPKVAVRSNQIHIEFVAEVRLKRMQRHSAGLQLPLGRHRRQAELALELKVARLYPAIGSQLCRYFQRRRRGLGRQRLESAQSHTQRAHIQLHRLRILPLHRRGIAELHHDTAIYRYRSQLDVIKACPALLYQPSHPALPPWLPALATSAHTSNGLAHHAARPAGVFARQSTPPAPAAQPDRPGRRLTLICSTATGASLSCSCSLSAVSSATCAITPPSPQETSASVLSVALSCGLKVRLNIGLYPLQRQLLQFQLELAVLHRCLAI